MMAPTKLSESGVGCYMGEYFLGALGYADDIVLIAPSPSAMRKLLAICDGYAGDYYFHADNSKSINLLVLTGVFWSRL